VVAGGVEAGAIQSGRGAGVEAGARDQALAAEQPSLSLAQVGAGQVKRRSDGQVLRVYQGQPVPGRGQMLSLLAWAAGGVVAQPPGDHPDRQGQVPAQPGDLIPLPPAGPPRGGPLLWVSCERPVW
jgi:hypothetical protein